MPRAVSAAVEAALQRRTPWCRPGCLSLWGLHLPTLSLQTCQTALAAVIPSPGSWPCHTHPWENLQMHPEQNTEAWVSRAWRGAGPLRTQSRCQVAKKREMIDFRVKLKIKRMCFNTPLADSSFCGTRKRGVTPYSWMPYVLPTRPLFPHLKE